MEENNTQYPRLAKHPHMVYDEIFNKEESNKLFQELSSKERIPPGRLRDISNQTKIKYKTLETWRKKLKLDPDYKPKHGHKGEPKKLSKDQEDAIFKQLNENFLVKSRYCPPRTIKAIAKNDFNDKNFGDDRLKGFMGRYHLSSRVPHLKRRTSPDDQQVALFVNHMQLVNSQFPDDLIINVDETCWCIINGKLRTVASKGADDVRVILNDDQKKCLTVVASCTKAGERLPLWLIAKGKTNVCERKYRNDPRLRHYIQSSQLYVDHSENGWSNEDLMIRYLEWLKNYKKGYMFNVVWDLHASHRSESVKGKAQGLEIGLSFIPVGQTGEWQPLDRRIFGILKAKACSMFDSEMISKNLQEFDIIDAIVILLRCWTQITQSEIISAWKHLQ